MSAAITRGDRRETTYVAEVTYKAAVVNDQQTRLHNRLGKRKKNSTAYPYSAQSVEGSG